ncbi:BrnT family toxin [Roseibacillus ishigakijimensis]|nr:BrnT family toxin [Roseibacillus ishigakijimensis]
MAKEDELSTFCLDGGGIRRHLPPAAMELDILDVSFDTKTIKPREIEEALEDPFAVRLLPENDRADGESRFYAIGKSIANRHLFLAFSTDGKKVRVVAARDASEDEETFYERKFAEFK